MLPDIRGFSHSKNSFMSPVNRCFAVAIFHEKGARARSNKVSIERVPATTARNALYTPSESKTYDDDQFDQFALVYCRFLVNHHVGKYCTRMPDKQLALGMSAASIEEVSVDVMTYCLCSVLVI